MHYYKENSNFKEGLKVGEGEILLIAPRHPSKGKQGYEKWDDTGVNFEGENWGTGPQQNAEDVDSLTCCCCECCHRNCLQSVSPDCLCGVFPLHSTANQFFTPRMFRAYHCEGYNACSEAKVAEFFLETSLRKHHTWGPGVVSKSRT